MTNSSAMDPSKISAALSAAGLVMNADGSVTNPSDPSAPLPPSIAMNGAADGQGRFYSAKEFSALLATNDALCSAPCADEKKPYAEKYSARSALDEARKNIETKRVLAMVDSASPTPPATLKLAQQQAARLEFRLGRIASDTEEGSVVVLEHLTAAMPSLVSEAFLKAVDALSVEPEGGFPKDQKNVPCSLPPVPAPPADLLPEVASLLNIAAVCFCNRENFPLCLALLHASVALTKSAGGGREADLAPLETQATFFLAQAYGAAGDGPNSATYCGLTTVRQLKYDYDAASPPSCSLDPIDWCRNVMTLAGFYANSDTRQADHCYRAVAVVLEAYLSSSPLLAELEYDLKEMQTDLEKSRAEFYMGLLAQAAEVHSYAQEAGTPPAPPPSSEELPPLAVDFSSLLPTLPPAAGFVLPPDRFLASCRSYEFARSIFLPANALISDLLPKHPVDGHVSTHIELCLWRSALFKHVAAFEADEKRKLAMLKKRVEAVEPVLHKGVNEQAYMGLVKTVYHDVGSGYLDLFECKYYRIEGKMQQDPGYQLKQVEAAKCNEFMQKSVSNFSSFIRLYWKPDKMAAMENEGKEDMGDGWMTLNILPDKDELSAYLGAHFRIARLLSKALPKPGPGGHAFVVECLGRSAKRFQFYMDFVDAHMRKGEKKEEFKEELGDLEPQYDIAKQMCELLPLKMQASSQGKSFVGAA